MTRLLAANKEESNKVRGERLDFLWNKVDEKIVGAVAQSEERIKNKIKDLEELIRTSKGSAASSAPGSRPSGGGGGGRLGGRGDNTQLFLDFSMVQNPNVLNWWFVFFEFPILHAF